MASVEPVVSVVPLPVTILTGFLGSGKTTLLNQLLREPHGLRCAVIVNEFGSVGIDGALVEGGQQFVELDNGCLCCALNADLQATLASLRERGGFDHLIIETTGLADPLPVAWTIDRAGDPPAYVVDAVITLVDAASVAHVVATCREAREQLQRADLLLLGKLDLVHDQGAAATALLRSLNELAPIVHRQPETPPPWDLLLGRRGDRPLAPLPASHGHHRPSFISWTFTTDAVLQEAQLEAFLDDLPETVFRAKGLVRLDSDWVWTLVNVVGGRLELRPCAPERPLQASTLVFMGATLPEAQLAADCAALAAGTYGS